MRRFLSFCLPTLVILALGHVLPVRAAEPAASVAPAKIELPAIGEEVSLPRIKEICALYGLHALWQKIERDPPPLPFKSDGCTGWVNEWKGVSIYPAGFLHDLKYWAGYPGEDVERLVADAELMIDVARLLGSTTMAETMFHGVRIGGTETLNASFSWGFGRKAATPALTTSPKQKTSKRSGVASPPRAHSGLAAEAKHGLDLRNPMNQTLPMTPITLSAKIPVVLDTDIGSDVDDTWALAQLLRSPELDVKLVLTESGDTRYRAKVTAKFLEAAGRTDVSVGIGIRQWELPPEGDNQSPWVAGYDLEKYPGHVHEDGIRAFIDLVMASPVPVTVISISPVPTLAKALQLEPRIAAKCRLVAMYGSFDKGYDDSPTPAAETNVRLDPAALRTVLAAPWIDILLTPLDTCGIAILGGANYHAIWSATGDPMLRALIENYCIFAPRVHWMRCDYFTTRSTVLFDCVAIYLAYSEKLVEIETVTFDVTDDGFTRRSETGPFQARVALRWKDLGAFEDHLTRRLLGKS